MSACEYCGLPIEPGAIVCSGCGAPVPPGAAPPVTNPSQNAGIAGGGQGEHRVILLSPGSCSDVPYVLQQLIGYDPASISRLLGTLPAEIACGLSREQAQYLAQAMTEYGMQVTVSGGSGYVDMNPYANQSVFGSNGTMLSSAMAVLGTITAANQVRQFSRWNQPDPFRYAFRPRYRFSVFSPRRQPMAPPMFRPAPPPPPSYRPVQPPVHRPAPPPPPMHRPGQAAPPPRRPAPPSHGGGFFGGGSAKGPAKTSGGIFGGSPAKGPSRSSGGSIFGGGPSRPAGGPSRPSGGGFGGSRSGGGPRGGGFGGKGGNSKH